MLVGVRPEKMRILARATGARSGRERARPAGSSPTRASSGVSTQYVVRLPSGQAADGVRAEPGRRATVAGRRAGHAGWAADTFGLDGDAGGRAEGDASTVARRGVSDARGDRSRPSGHSRRAPASGRRRRRRAARGAGAARTCCCCPACSGSRCSSSCRSFALLATSLQTPVARRRGRRVRADLPLAELHRRPARVLAARPPVVRLRAARHVLAWPSATRWRTRSRFRAGPVAQPAAGRWSSRRSSPASSCARSPGGRSSPTTGRRDRPARLHLLPPDGR